MANVLITGSSEKRMPIVLIIVLAAGMVVIVLRSTNNQFDRLLKQPTPQPLVEWFQGNLKRMPKRAVHGDAMGASTLANVYAYYGDFAAARAQLETVDWSSKPPAIAAVGISSRKEGDIAHG